MTELTKPVNPNTAIAIVSAVANPVSDLNSDAAPVGARVMNFDQSHPKFAEWLFVAEETATKEPEQFYEQPFRLVAWIAKKVELPDPDTGKTFTLPRVTLIDQDGETLSFCSVGVVSSLDLIRAVYGDGPWPDGLPVVCRREKTRAGAISGV